MNEVSWFLIWVYSAHATNAGNSSLPHTCPIPLKKKKKWDFLFFCELSHLHCPVKILFPISVPTQLPVSLFIVFPPLFLPYFFMSVEELCTNVHNRLSRQHIPVTGMVLLSQWFHQWKYMCIFMVDYTLIYTPFLVLNVFKTLSSQSDLAEMEQYCAKILECILFFFFPWEITWSTHRNVLKIMKQIL